MKENYLSIGEVAKLANISIQTLRYYDQIDLFKPIYTDEKTNYRYYKDSQLYHLDLIKSLKHLGTSLEEIKLAQQKTPEELLQFLEKQEQIIEERVNKLKEVQQKLLKTKKQLAEQLAIPKYNEVFEQYEEEEHVLAIKTTNLSPEYIPSSYYSSLKTIIENSGGIIASRYGCKFELKKYSQLDEIQYDYVFTPLMSTRVIRNITADMEFTNKPAGRYLCIAFLFDPDNYFKHYLKLQRFVEEQKISVYNEVYEIFMPANYSPLLEDAFVVELMVRMKE